MCVVVCVCVCVLMMFGHNTLSIPRSPGTGWGPRRPPGASWSAHGRGGSQRLSSHLPGPSGQAGAFAWSMERWGSRNTSHTTQPNHNNWHWMHEYWLIGGCHTIKHYSGYLRYILNEWCWTEGKNGQYCAACLLADSPVRSWPLHAELTQWTRRWSDTQSAPRVFLETWETLQAGFWT